MAGCKVTVASSRSGTCANIFSSKLFAAAADYKSQLVGSQIQTVCLSNQLSLFLPANTDAADFKDLLQEERPNTGWEVEKFKTS